MTRAKTPSKATRTTRARTTTSIAVAVGDDEARLRAFEADAELLMNLLAKDLRCLDAHAHLGNLEFEHNPPVPSLLEWHRPLRVAPRRSADGDGSLPEDVVAQPE
jgi:hypothetical protein